LVKAQTRGFLYKKAPEWSSGRLYMKGSSYNFGFTFSDGLLDFLKQGFAVNREHDAQQNIEDQRRQDAVDEGTYKEVNTHMP
jgi:hypothetical protein